MVIDSESRCAGVEELERLNLDPGKAIFDGFIVCLECGERITSLWRHLSEAHEGITVAEYKSKAVPGSGRRRYGPKEPVQPRNVTGRQRKAALADPNRDEQLKQVRKLDKLIEGAARVRGRRRLSASFAAKKRAALGKPNLRNQRVSDAEINELRQQGKTGTEIARTLGRNRSGIATRLKKAAHGTEAYAMDHGVPIDAAYAQNLLTDFGFGTNNRLAKSAGIALPTLLVAMKGAVSVQVGKKLKKCRAFMTQQLCYDPHNPPAREFTASEALSLPTHHAELTDVFVALNKWRRSQKSDLDAAVDKEWGWLCEQVRAEALDGTGMRKFTLLRNLWPDYKRLVTEKGGPTFSHMRPNEVARRVLALSYGTTANRVKDLLDGKLLPLSSKELGIAVRNLGSDTKAISEDRKKSGRPKREVGQRAYELIGKAVKQELPRMQQAMTTLADAKKADPSGTEKWKSRLVAVGFTAEEAAAIVASKTAMGAAERFVASHRHMKLEAVQNACSLYRRSLKHPSN